MTISNLIRLSICPLRVVVLIGLMIIGWLGDKANNSYKWWDDTLPAPDMPNWIMRYINKVDMIKADAIKVEASKQITPSSLRRRT